jgi:acyl transferase domain-containing protein
LNELAAKWTAGEEVNWESLYAHAPRRVSVPTYPFARERYWVSDSPAERPALAGARPHPLIAYNASTLKEVSFISSLSDNAFYAVDHKVHDDRIFPGAGFLEMACISANIASDRKVRKITDVVWIQPLSFRSGPQTLRTVLRHNGKVVEYEISSLDDENETIVHSEGRIAYATGLSDAARTEERVDIQALKAQCVRSEDRAAYYETFRTFGLQYGSSFQTIQELYVTGSFALSRLKIAEHLKGEFGQFILHPSIIDGALQTVGGLMRGGDGATPYLPFALDELEILGPVPQACYAYAERADAHNANRGGVMKFNIRILNEAGDVLIRIRNLYVRPLAKPQPTSQGLAESSARGQLVRMSGESAD